MYNVRAQSEWKKTVTHMLWLGKRSLQHLIAYAVTKHACISGFTNLKQLQL
jgi:hypothetical protein